ncbi:MAG: class II aldolase [Curvibacter sp. PD_MW3]|nr:MAG: class II aldolase [Curvibacter sp. PD_MW3]
MASAAGSQAVDQQAPVFGGRSDSASVVPSAVLVDLDVAELDAEVRLRVGPEQWRTRVELAAAYQLAARLGWTDHIFTHFSARVPGHEGRFLINSFGLRFDEIRPSNLVEVDVHGEVLSDPLGLGHNLAGFVIHGAIHGARPDAAAVLHTHTTSGVAVSAQQDGLLMLSQHAARYWGRVAYHDFEGFAFDYSEQERLVAELDDKRVLILRNHGLLTIGRSIGEAFQELYFLERACAIQIAAQAGGQALIVPPESVLQKTAQVYERSTGTAYTARIWDAFLRQIHAADVHAST